MNNAMTAHDLALHYLFDMRMLGARAKSDCSMSLSEREKALSTISWASSLKLSGDVSNYIRKSDEQSLHSLSLAARPSKTALSLSASPFVVTTFTSLSSLGLLVYRKHSQHSSSLCPIAAIPSYLVLRRAIAQYNKSWIVCINTRNSLTLFRSLSAANTTAV
uniref:Uncharacterized protein n=1 Tax=Hyaloperonospora arabidopsidis (strain Emoy2) TaxID=559515 RepID=M4BLV2_HYAAE